LRAKSAQLGWTFFRGDVGENVAGAVVLAALADVDSGEVIAGLSGSGSSFGASSYHLAASSGLPTAWKVSALDEARCAGATRVRVRRTQGWREWPGTSDVIGRGFERTAGGGDQAGGGVGAERASFQ
jgi:hypothetical protein